MATVCRTVTGSAVGGARVDCHWDLLWPWTPNLPINVPAVSALSDSAVSCQTIAVESYLRWPNPNNLPIVHASAKAHN